MLSTALIAVMCVFAIPAQAQLGKSLKKLGQSAADAAVSSAGELAADAAANKVSVKIVTWMDNNNTPVAEDSEYYTRLAELVSPKYITVDGVSFNYKIYENPEVNMIGTADGSIRVYTGMMDTLNNDELLAIIAVQIGHIINKDTRDALMDVASEDNATKATTAQLEKLLSFSGERMGTIVNELLQVPYSDKQNTAADKYALSLLKKNGTPEQGLYSALMKFAEMEKQDKAAEADDTLEYSAASKFITVNPNNASRASAVR